MYPACNHRFPGALAPSETNELGKVVRMKAAALDMLHNSVEDLKNELAGFKKTMAGVCRKYDDNFRRNGASARHLHEGWLSHETAIAPAQIIQK